MFEVDLLPFAADGANQKMDNIYDLFKGGQGIAAEGEWAGVLCEIERLKSAD